MTNRYLYITLLAVLGFKADFVAGKTVAKGVPRLVVNITIDQLRSDYLETFAPYYSNKGFLRLLSEGMVYTNVSYPFTPVDRASATAAIATGVTPYYNNIIGRQWLNRETLRPVGCVDDKKYTGLGTLDTTSPSKLSTSTLSDELKMASGGKAIVFAIAPFRDAAVLSGGHAADGALWIDDWQGEWCSSCYYYKSLPPWIQDYDRQQAPCRRIDKIEWTSSPLMEKDGADIILTSEQVPFKYRFTGQRRYQEFKTSALVNAEVTDVALQCVANNGMGDDRVTDLLNITYYAGRFNDKDVTDCQSEILDTYIRLDNEVGRLIDKLENRLGLANVLFVLTSTGYCDEEKVDYNAYRIPTGTFYMKRASNLLNIYLGAIWGQGNYVETTYRNQMFLNRKLLETKKISMADALGRAQEFLSMMTGIRNVYTSLQLLTSNDEQIQKVRNAYNPENCGDVVIEAAPGWHVLNEDTYESELSRAAHIQFPIIFYGAGITSEQIPQPVTVDQIAPTIARAIRIRAPNACSSKPLF
ncbi:MAG: alkaline phosphatase family protein [Prevotella sp.]|nr:alkaline phosphatase family protein [Prevotella sp.]